MEDNEDYNPLLGYVNERLEGRRKSASTRAPQRPVAEGTAATSPSDETVRDVSHALNLRDVAAAGFLYGIVSSSMSAEISAEAFTLYREMLLADAGNPSDPIEIMLIEQLAVAHFAIGRLQIKACSINNAKLSIAYSDTATRLLGEFRRCSLALEDLREKQAARKERSGKTDVAERTVPAEDHGKPRASSNGKQRSRGKKGTHESELPTNEGIPECIRERMGCTIPGALQPAAATDGNGKG